MRWHAGVATVAMLLGSTVGCERAAPAADAAGDGEVVRGGTAVIVSSTDFDHLNALVSADRYTQEVLRFALFLPLLRYGDSLTYRPALARDWHWTGDTAVVFQLRDDIRWHDGARTTAYDVAFTFERAKHPETGFPSAGYFAHWTAVEVVDSFTVRFRVEPHADALAGVPLTPIMPRHLLDSVPAARMRQAAFNRAPVGNGPFRFVEVRPQERWVFEANEDFPDQLGGRPHVDRLVWRVLTDVTAQVTEVRTGQAHLALNPRYEHVQEANADASVRVVVRPSRQYAFVAWNARRPPFDDARVRRALGLAIDRAEILATLRGDMGQLAAGPIPPYHWSYDPAIEPLPFAPDSARALLRAAGIADRDGDGLLDAADGRDFAFVLKLPSANSLNRDMSEMIASDLADIGVQVRIQPTEYGTLVGDLTGAARAFDAVLMGWESDFRIDLRGLFHSAELENPFQFAGYRNARVDSLIDRSAAEPDRDTARPLFAEIQQRVRDDQPWTFLYYYPDLYLRNERLRAVRMDIRGALVGVTDWWLAPESPAPSRSD